MFAYALMHLTLLSSVPYRSSPLRSLRLALTIYLAEQIDVAGQPFRRVLHLIF